MKLTLTRVYRTKEKKDGTPLIKGGKPYERIAVMTKEYGDKWVGGFNFDGWTDGWKEGDTITVVVEESEWQGKPQLNLRKETLADKRMDKIEERLARLEKGGVPSGMEGLEVQTEAKIDVNSLPF